MNLEKAAVMNGIALRTTATETPKKNPGLERSAHEFEASLMAELLKPLQESDGLTGESSSDAGEGSGGALAGFASESLARAISERGGFGIADRILHQLEPAKAAHGQGQKASDSAKLKFPGKPSI